MPPKISVASLAHWKHIPSSLSDIDLSTLLSCGQTFSWRKAGVNSEGPEIWLNAIGSSALAIKQDEAGLHWTVLDEALHEDLNSVEEQLRDYLNFSVSLPDMYQTWSEKDPKFSALKGAFRGIRILRQDPVENLFSFICSSNNHISRIGGMVLKLAKNYGKHLITVNDFDVHAFPTIAALCDPGVEDNLRRLGFGYRAKFISATARILHNERPEKFLYSLRDRPYQECITELMKFVGVGRKVADCVSLMSLDKHHVVPVDTHVLQIATRDYKIPGLKDMKSLTPAIHNKIGEYFVDLYGPYAGWAHTVLFTADLAKFQERNPKKRKKIADRPAPTEDVNQQKRMTKEEKANPKTKYPSPLKSPIQPNECKYIAKPKSQPLRRSNRNVS